MKYFNSTLPRELQINISMYLDKFEMFTVFGAVNISILREDLSIDDSISDEDIKSFITDNYMEEHEIITFN